MSAMGGLRRRMPATFWCMTIGLGALVGLPPLAGFWSKDAILHEASAADAGWLPWLVYGVGVLTVVITAWYATRLWLRVFFGSPRSPGAAHAHEPPAAMAWPVLVLAVPSALLGLAAFLDGFAPLLAPGGFPVAEGSTEAVELVHIGVEALVPLAALALGALLVWAMWRRDPELDPADALGPLRPAFANAFWFDDVQNTLVVRPVRALATAVRGLDERVVDGAVEGTGQGTADLGARMASWHRAGLPRAATAVLAGALILGLAAVVVGAS
jgi:NADH-quinone oxidoreductase subunit L